MEGDGQRFRRDRFNGCTGRGLERKDPQRYGDIVQALQRKEPVNDIKERCQISLRLIRAIRHREGLDTAAGFSRAAHAELLRLGTAEMNQRITKLTLADLTKAMQWSWTALRELE